MKNFLIAATCIVSMVSSNARAFGPEEQLLLDSACPYYICMLLESPCGVPNEQGIYADPELGKCAQALQSCSADDVISLKTWGVSNSRICDLDIPDEAAFEKIYMEGSKQAIAALSPKCLEALQQAGVGR